MSRLRKPTMLNMPTVVVGGHTRNIGKTSVVAGLIRDLRSLDWTAVKITQFGHGVCSHDGHQCECAPRRHAFEISEERNRRGCADTCRYLAAGAVRSIWMRVRSGQLGAAATALFEALENSRHVILESNSILQYLTPSLFLMVLDSSQADFKPSAQAALRRADAWVVTGRELSWEKWSKLGVDCAATLPMFMMDLAAGPGPELREFVRERISEPMPAVPRD